VSLPATSETFVDIRPSINETWFVSIDFFINASIYNSRVTYYAYDSVTAIPHAQCYISNYSYSIGRAFLGVTKILTNSLYARLGFYNDGTSVITGYYGYSGFKLSKPLYAPARNIDLKPFRLKTDLPLPDPVKALDKYKCLIFDHSVNDYVLAIALEENTPLAIDPSTNEVVESLSVYVRADVLADLILKFKRKELDVEKSGYRKYIDKLLKEGISII
jgi:hypothetical protein